MPENKQWFLKIQKMFKKMGSISKIIFQWCWIPFILIVAMNNEPYPSLWSILVPLIQN